eukprot:403364031
MDIDSANQKKISGFSRQNFNTNATPNFQQKIQESLEDPTYGHYEYDQIPYQQQYSNTYAHQNQNKSHHQRQQSGNSQGGNYQKRNSYSSQKSNNSNYNNSGGRNSYNKNRNEELPIADYQTDRLNISVHINKLTGKEKVVILKRTIKSFAYHADNYYRDSGSKRNNFTNQEIGLPQDKELKKFYKHRYYLFSKFDRGIKIDEESWYSITPETVAKHVASRVTDVFGEGNANVIDGFCGVGGNVIQFARKCAFAIGNDFDGNKCESCKHNAQIYSVDNKLQVINKDFLKMKIEDITYPQNTASRIDVVFMSPPWGGVGYNQLEEYKLEYLFPDFTETVKSALNFSRNLIFFLPKNTSIKEIIDTLLPHAREFNDDPDSDRNELIIEVEQIMYGESCKGIHIYTGELVQIDQKELVDHFYNNYCHPFSKSDESYLRVILGNIFQLCGYNHFVEYFKNKDGPKVSLQKIIKKIQKSFSEEEWNFLKKYHKRSRTNSKKSSTLSHFSHEEEKRSMKSENSSVKSLPRSTTSSNKEYKIKDGSTKLSRAEKLGQKYSEKYDIKQNSDDEEMDIPENQQKKKVVHFQDTSDHILELKDLTEKDFVDLLASKNQDQRFYGWLHFGPFDDHKEKQTDPVQDIEYFKWLYDSNLFNSNDVTMEDEEIKKRQRNYSMEEVKK